MVDYRTDDEQVEALKNWWDENGTSLIVTVAVSLLVVFAFRTWQADVKEKGEAASGLYQDLIETVIVAPGQQLEESSLQTGKYLADSLKGGYEDSVYASLAAMAMAKQAVESGDLAAAEEELRWVVDRNSDEEVALVARLRLARVFAAQERFDEALAIIEIADAGSHRASVEEIRGDIYLRMEREGDAAQAFQRALDALPEPDSKPMLQMKLEDLSPAVATMSDGSTAAATAAGDDASGMTADAPAADDSEQ